MSDTGFIHLPGFLSPEEIARLIEAARAIGKAAPFLRPRMADGTPLKLTVTNAGPWGWWADMGGYRYVDRHPVTGKPWPPIPPFILLIAARILEAAHLPPMVIDNLLINHYAPGESLGLHVDRTEEDRAAPILSLSVGAEALFQLGGPDRRDPVTDYLLKSGDVCVQAGPSRGWFHGIKRIYPTLPNPLKDGSRLNFTIRKVKRIEAKTMQPGFPWGNT